MMRFLIILSVLSSCSSLSHKPIILPEGETFLIVKYGKVHRSCLTKIGQPILDVIDSYAEKGLACLRSLKGEGSAYNIKKFQALFAKKSITFTCQNTDFGWGDHYLAMASTGPGGDEPDLKLFHPYIALNPKKILMGSPEKGEVMSPELLKPTIFHESFHNLGYSHGRTPDYSYACEECCFPIGGGEDTDAACKICATKYKGVSDTRYYSDFWKWSQESRMRKYFQHGTIVRKALLEKPGSDLWTRLFFELYTENNLIMKFLGLALPSKNYAHTASKMEVPSQAKELIPTAQELAKAEYELYIKGNYKKVYNYYLNINPSIVSKGLRSKNKVLKQFSNTIWKSILYDIRALEMIYEKQVKPSKRLKDKFKILSQEIGYEWE